MLTEQERDQMAHAIGHETAKGCSRNGGRNYAVARGDDPVWSGLVDRKLATSRSSSLLPAGDAVFHVTDEGRLAVEQDQRTIEALRARGRRYAIVFRGYEGSVAYAHGVTRGKAKSVAAREYGDLFPDGDGYMRIVSCRLAE